MGNIPNVEIEIDLKQLFRIIKKRIWLILLITFVVTIACGIISFYLLTPIYEASTELLVNKSDSNIDSLYSYTEIQADLKLINTYKVIIKSPRIIDIVVSKFDQNLSTADLINKIKVNTVEESQVISISVTDSDYRKAVMLVNALADTFQNEIVKIMKVDNVQILTAAKIIDDPVQVKPSPVLNIVIAFIFSLIIGICLVLLLEHFDKSVKHETDVERILGYPVLGSISVINKKESTKKIIHKKQQRRGTYEVEG